MTLFFPVVYCSSDMDKRNWCTPQRTLRCRPIPGYDWYLVQCTHSWLSARNVWFVSGHFYSLSPTTGEFTHTAHPHRLSQASHHLLYTVLTLDSLIAWEESTLLLPPCYLTLLDWDFLRNKLAHDGETTTTLSHQWMTWNRMNYSDNTPVRSC